ncbi:MAG: hypothetical protein KDA44_06945 [Planctomycetales bacterium]|nr:hypothetical protein [Planctomycetales bacterium]
MKSRMFAFATALLCATVAPGAVFGQVLMLEDFEGPLPGTYTGFPGGWSFWGDGDDLADLVVTQEITDQVAFSGVQGYQITYDTSLINSWNYFGMGGFLGFWGAGNGAGAGQPGADNPANYKLSFDINIQGVNSGDEIVNGNVSLFKGDYEATFGVDLNNDGDMEDGYNYWSSNFSTNMGAADGWVHVEWNLASGSAPTVPDTDGVAYFPAPIFDDETTFQYGFYPKESDFGLDADNIINVDNFQFEFLAPVVGPGDFDEDGDVDGGDFLAWQRGDSPTPLSADDLAAWQANFGGGGALASVAAGVPEPGSLLLAALSAALVVGARRRS